jgi:hypothetical protein
MGKPKATHRVVPLPRMRQVYIDTLHLGHRKHAIHALVEADVTTARRILAEQSPHRGGPVVHCLCPRLPGPGAGRRPHHAHPAQLA